MEHSIEILPAILPKLWQDISNKLQQLGGAAPCVQIDVLDGVFAPNKTWPYIDAQSFDQSFYQDDHGKLFGKIEIEFDLMVDDPNEVVDFFLKLGAARVVIHAKSKTALLAFQKVQAFNKTAHKNIALGLALPANFNNSDIEPFLGFFEYIQIMGIQTIGYQAQAFYEPVLERIEKMKAEYPAWPVQVDGGVSMDTEEKILQAGATRLVVGSAIFSAVSPHEAYETLKKHGEKMLKK